MGASDPTLIRQAFRFALEPTHAQEERLIAFAGAARFAFNWGLGMVKERLDPGDAGEQVPPIPWSYKGLCSEWAKVKDEVAPWRDEVIVGSFQAGFEGLAYAFKHYFEARAQGGARKMGFPGFRSRHTHEPRFFSQEARCATSATCTFRRSARFAPPSG